MGKSSTLIHVQRELDAALRESPPYLALDTEFHRRTTYYPVPCVLQIKTGNALFAIDALEDLNYDVLVSYLQDGAIPKIMHDPDQDFEIMQLMFDVLPDHVFDTQLANAFLSTDATISYQALVIEYLGIELDKRATTSDWQRRPLSSTQLLYALDDVKYLPELYVQLRERLKQYGRLDWFLEESDRKMKEKSQDEGSSDVPTPGAERLNGIQTGVLKAFNDWRITEARERNEPKNWILKTSQLLALAKSTKLNARHIKNLIGREKFDEFGFVLLDIYRQKMSEHPENAVNPDSLRRVSRRLIRDVRQICNEEANRLKMCPTVLGSKRDLYRFAEHFLDRHTWPSWFGNWRFELFGDRFVHLLNSYEAAGQAFE